MTEENKIESSPEGVEANATDGTIAAEPTPEPPAQEAQPTSDQQQESAPVETPVEAPVQTAESKTEGDVAQPELAQSDTPAKNTQETRPAKRGRDNKGDKNRRGKNHKKFKFKANRELERLADFATKFPEIGTTVAELAYKVGSKEVGDRVTAMGLESGEYRMEFYLVAANVARRDKDSARVLELVNEALDKAKDGLQEFERNAFLRIARLGFAVLLFDLKDLTANPKFTETVSTVVPPLATTYGEDAAFASLLAQSLWFSDKEKAEAQWEKAVTLGDAETAWNARGTWTKEAEKNLERAVEIYGSGLVIAPESALLGNNLAQVKLDLYEAAEDPPKEALNEVDQLLRDALSHCKRRGYRRHIHETIDRMKLIRSGGPEVVPLPKVGDLVRGRVKTLAKYGAFLTLRGGHSGLLHNSEIAHHRVNDPASVFTVGDMVEVKVIELSKQDDGTFRIGFSRKAVLAEPSGGGHQSRKPKKNSGKGKKGGGKKKHQSKPKEHKGGASFSLGEMLLAKLEEKEGEKN